MVTTISELKERLNVPSTSSSYPLLGRCYARTGHQIEYSNRLVRTGRSYYDSRPKDGRMSTTAEELAIQLGLEKAGKDPRNEKVFDDLFARNESKIYMWQWTETGLRVPKGRDPTKYETDGQGRKYWPRIVLEDDKEVGEILVPEGVGRVIVEWDEVFGLAKTTDEIGFPHEPYTTHFWFNPNPGKDSKSGHYDVAVGRRSGWLLGEGGGCLDVGAFYARSAAGSDGGFRPVRGSAAEVKKTKIADEMQKDYGTIPFAEFRKKYQL